MKSNVAIAAQAQAPRPPKGELRASLIKGSGDVSPFGGWGASIWSWAAMATLIFIVHPLHVEVVANIKGRDDIIAFMGEMVLFMSRLNI